MNLTKRCSRCKAEKPANREHFSFIACRNKWHPWCKPCCAEDRRRDRAENPDRYRAIDARRDPDRRRALGRDSYKRHADKRKAEMRARWAANAEAINAERRHRKQSDPAYAARVKELRDATVARHGHRYNAQRRQAWAKASPHKRLRTYFTSAICHSLKGSTKGGRSWEAILGYSTEDLKAHIERQFQRGMSWDNYGEWHVDHIVPVAEFAFTSADDPEFKACWALTNLRPLWARDNLTKREKRTHLI